MPDPFIFGINNHPQHEYIFDAEQKNFLLPQRQIYFQGSLIFGWLLSIQQIEPNNKYRIIEQSTQY